MTRRFYAAAIPLDTSTLSLDGVLAHRLASVLRLRPGDVVVLFDGSGEDVFARLDTVSTKGITATVVERIPSPTEARTRVHLYQSITKGDRFDWLVEKVTELGVARIVPLTTARSTVRTGDGNKLDRWQRIAVEAAEQCGRGAVPRVEPPQHFTEALAAAPGLLVLPYESAEDTAPSVQDALNARIDDLFATAAVSIFIGPEGGYDEAEVEAAVDAGATVVSLGTRVLRSETAGLVATTLVMQACGELG